MKITKKLCNGIKNLPKNLLNTVIRFPLPSIFIAVFFTLCEIMVYNNFEGIEKMLTSTLFAFFLSYSATFLAENKKPIIKIFLPVIPIFLGIIYYLSDIGYLCEAAIIIASASLAILAMDFFDRKYFEEHLSIYLSRLFTAFVFASVFMGGVALILAGIDILLITVSYKTYETFVFISYALMMPLLFLSWIPKKNDEVKTPKVINLLWTYIVMPLIAVFTVVLYVYYLKLLMTRSLPIGLLGGISLIYLAVCIPSALMCKNFESKFVKVMISVIPYLILPVIAILFWADFRQILNYGYSITRLLVLLGGIASFVSALLFIIGKGKMCRFVLLTITVLALVFAIFGEKIVFESQNKRFHDVLVRNNMLINGEIVQNDSVCDNDKRELYSILRYLSFNNLSLPSDYPSEKFADAKEILGFEDVIVPAKSNVKHAGLQFEEFSFPLEGYDYIICPATFKIDDRNKNNIGLNAYTEDTVIYVKDGDNLILKADTNEFIESLFEMKKEYYTPEEMTFEYENENVKIKALIISAYKSDTYVDVHVRDILIKIK